MLGALAFMRSNTSSAIDEFQIFLAKTDSTESSRVKRRRKEAESLLPQLKFEIEFYANEGKYDPTPLPLTSLDNDEYLPAISPDGSILFFTRASKLKARGDVVTKRIEELVWSKRSDSNTPFDSGEILDYPFIYDYFYIFISISNLNLYII